MEVVRKVAFLDIEGKYYEDVTMSFKSITPDYFISDKYKEVLDEPLSVDVNLSNT